MMKQYNLPGGIMNSRLTLSRLGLVAASIFTVATTIWVYLEFYVIITSLSEATT